MKKYLALLLTAALCACAVPPEVAEQTPAMIDQLPALETRTISLLDPQNKEMVLTAEIADEPAEQSQGLMGRTDLPENQGMFFVFADNQPLTFWMKNTLIPLDIVYFAADGSFVSSATMQPCEADPCPIYPSEGPAKYALEMEEGFIETNGVGNGWKLLLP